MDAGSNQHSASNWTLQNATVTGGFALFAPGHNITINHVQTGNFYMGGPWNVTVENSNLGPCYNLVSLPAGQTNGNGDPGPTYSPNPAVSCNNNIKLDSDGTLANITFKNNVIHDFRLSSPFGGDLSVRERDRNAGAAEVDRRDQGVGGVESVGAV